MVKLCKSKYTPTFSAHFQDFEGGSRHVIQYHYTTWPDHGVPSHATALWRVHREVTSGADKEKPIVVHCRLSARKSMTFSYLTKLDVHCSAGVGPTGTFVAMDRMLEQANEQNGIDVFRCVASLREGRVNMVQAVVGLRSPSSLCFISLSTGSIPLHSPRCSRSIHGGENQFPRSGLHGAL